MKTTSSNLSKYLKMSYNMHLNSHWAEREIHTCIQLYYLI